MEGLPEVTQIQNEAQEFLAYALGLLKEHAFVVGNLLQILVIAFAFGIAKVVAPRFTAWMESLNAKPHRFTKQTTLVVWVLQPLMLPVMWLFLQWVAVVVANYAGWPHHVMRAVVSLLTAWVLIRLMANVVVHSAWSKAIAVTAWTVAALNIVGLLGPTVEILDDLAMDFGDFHLSLLGLIKGIVALIVFLWLASAVARLTENRLAATTSLTPSARVLFGKLARILLFTSAILIGLNSVGIDLTAFAVFTGAVGLGIGFGLQKVFSNLISGVILLMDKSVKPGDVIAIGNTFGWINSLGARYVSLITRDGTEHLIPNEELISQRVENWSYSHQLVRLKLPFGISYSSDPRRAMELALQVAKETKRVLVEPAPACRLLGFGESQLDLELRVWINDPQAGVANVISDVLLGLWDAFHEHGIEFPFPQRDLHLRSAVPLPIMPTDGVIPGSLDADGADEGAAPEGFMPPKG